MARQPALTTMVGPLLLLVAVCAACSSSPARRVAPTSPAASPRATSHSIAEPTSALSTPGASRPKHVVIVVEENHSFDEVLNPGQAPFIAALATKSAVLTRSFGITHPSQPNYLALFSGSTQGVTDDSCPRSFASANLGRSLLDAGLSFAGYSDGLPSPGFQGCSSGGYARKHNPWVDFTNLPADVNRPMTAFPTNFELLPTVSFVIPAEPNDMHSGSVAVGDQWLNSHLGTYATWASAHDSLLILTTDEDDYSSSNRILTLVYGAHVRPGQYDQRVDHYALLRTIEDLFALTPLGHSATATAIGGIGTR
jgi:hypothetical protein